MRLFAALIAISIGCEARAQAGPSAEALSIALTMLTPEERRVARKFYASSAGRKVALATFGIGDFRRLPPDAQMALYAELDRRSDQTTDNLTIPALAEKFRNAALTLPRAPTRDPQ